MMQYSPRLWKACITCTLVLVAMALPRLAYCDSVGELMKRRPELFHPVTGLRIDRQRAPTPDDIPPPAIIVDTANAAQLLEKGAVAIDVFGASQSHYDDLEGTWLVSRQRRSLPGATWLPEVGRGTLSAQMQQYLVSNIKRLTSGRLDKPLVVYCIADCWMSWNASQRIAALGYTRVHWYRLGTDGWLESGRELLPVNPVPVKVD